MKRLLLLSLFAAAALPSYATLADFEGLTSFAAVPQGYAGLYWTDASAALNATTYYGNPSGYQACKVSGDMVGYSADAGVFGWATMDGSNFQSLSWYIGAAWMDDITVTISYYEGGFLGTLISTQVMNPAPSSTGPEHWSLNFPGYMDAITFTIDENSGTQNPNYSSSGHHLVFDDIEYSTVPEPATFAAVGLGALLLLRRRR